MRATVRKSDPCYVLDCPAKPVVIADLGEVRQDGHVHRTGDDLVEITLCVEHARQFVPDPSNPADDPEQNVNVVLDPRKLHGWMYAVTFGRTGNLFLTLMPDPAARRSLRQVS